MRFKSFFWPLMAVTVLASSLSWADNAAAPEPDPRQVLQKMCDFLKSQAQFTYKAEIADDQVYYDGKKIQYGIDAETYVRRPDRLRVNAAGDLVNKQFFFDGKTITLYDKDRNVYGTMEVPPDIESALENLKTAIDLEPRNRYLARNDRDFTALTEDPRFADLVYPEKDGV